MTIRLLIPILLLGIISSLAISGAIKDGTLSAFSNGTNIIVRWISEDENGVSGYRVERKAGMSGPFVVLTDPLITSKGNGYTYEFIDVSAFRGTDQIYQYKITAIGTNAVYYTTVTHNVSSVKRTWGSIKAMFR